MKLQAQIRQIEYFWDTEKGFGQNTVVNVNQADGDFNLNVPMQGLSRGYHMLHVRSRDARGRWSHTQMRLVNVQTGAIPAKITQLDYTYTRSGAIVGQYVYKLLNPAASVQLTVPGDISQLINGQTYMISIWATDENGTRSLVYTQTFTYRTVDCKNLAIAVQGKNSFCKGASTVLTAIVSGGNTPTNVTWTRGGVEVGKGVSLTVSQAGTYTAQATDAQGCSVTNSTNVTEAPSPAVTIPVTASFCSGQTTTLTATATGGTGTYAYQWRQGTTNVGTNASTLNVNAGGTYSVVVTDAAGCSGVSSSATVTQRNSPSATVTPSSPGFIAGASVTLTANTGNGFSYQWNRNGNPIAGATQSTYSTNEQGAYSVTISQNGCSTTSQIIDLGLILSAEPIVGSMLLEVSPNPTSNYIQIVLTLDEPSKAHFSLTDITGRLIKKLAVEHSLKRHEITLEIGYIPNGTYFLKAESNQKQVTKKVLKL